MAEGLPNVVYRKAAAHNLACIVAALRAQGISRLTVEFDGFADEGRIEEIVAEPPGRNIDFELSGLQDVREVRPPESLTAQTADRFEVEHPRSLKDALEWYMHTLLAIEHPGWEQNDGSFGSISIDRHGATLLFDDRSRPFPQARFMPMLSPLEETAEAGLPEPSPFGEATA